MNRVKLALAAALNAVAAAGAASQLPNASAAALATTGGTASASGYAALAWNPANLALPGDGRVTLAILPAGVVLGLGPVSLGDIADQGDRFVPAATREAWLQRIREAGGQRGAAGGDVTYVAGSVGRVGFQLGTTARSLSRLNPDAAELLLFGNAGRGEPRDLALAGSSLDVAVASTAALGYAHPLRLPDGSRLAVGATFKYTVGHLLVTGRDAGSVARAEPVGLELRFPVVHTDTSLAFDNGGGPGLDLGVSWQRGGWTAGVVLGNVVNGFRWDEERMLFRPGEALFTGDSTRTGFDARPLAEAPGELRGWVDRVRPARWLAAGAAVRLSPRLALNAEARTALEERTAFDPPTRLGVGAELRPVPWLPLRAGAALVDEGLQLGAGAGVVLGPLRLDGALAHRDDEAGGSTVGLVTLSFGGR